jgi:hypothetical protein
MLIIASSQRLCCFDHMPHIERLGGLSTTTSYAAVLNDNDQHQILVPLLLITLNRILEATDTKTNLASKSSE